MTQVVAPTQRPQLVREVRNAAVGSDERLKRSAFMRWLKEIERAQGVAARADVLRTVLSQLVDEHAAHIETLNYPAAVRELVAAEFVRIRKVVEIRADDYFDFRHHALRCDLRIACFGRIPTGYLDIEVGGVPRNLICRGGIRQAWRFVRMVQRTGGVRPYYRTHLSKRVNPINFLRIVNRDAQERMYRNMAECLMLNPEYRGIASGSWFFDPQLEVVSPHLAFLRQFPVERGALLFRVGVTENKYGFAHSRHRQQLHEQGRYTPTNYALIWPRDAIISWAAGRRTSSRIEANPTPPPAASPDAGAENQTCRRR